MCHFEKGASLWPENALVRLLSGCCILLQCDKLCRNRFRQGEIPETQKIIWKDPQQLKLQKLKTYFRPKQWKIYKQPRSSSCSFNMSSMQLLFFQSNWNPLMCLLVCLPTCMRQSFLNQILLYWKVFFSKRTSQKLAFMYLRNTTASAFTAHIVSDAFVFNLGKAFFADRSFGLMIIPAREKKHPSKNRRSEKKKRPCQSWNQINQETQSQIVEVRVSRLPRFLWRLRVAKLPLSPKSKNRSALGPRNCMNQCQGSLMSKSNWPSLWSKGICWSISWKIMSQQTEPKNLPSIPRCFECI